MENGPVLEWSTGNIVLDMQEDKEIFHKLINGIQHHDNDDNNSDYVTDNYNVDDDRLGSWEAEYDSMDKEEGMIVTDDDISE